MTGFFDRMAQRATGTEVRWRTRPRAHYESAAARTGEQTRASVDASARERHVATTDPPVGMPPSTKPAVTPFRSEPTEGDPPVEDPELLDWSTGVGRIAGRQAGDRQRFAGPTPSTRGRDAEDNGPAFRDALRDPGARAGAEPLASDPPVTLESRPAQVPPTGQPPARPAGQTRIAAQASRTEIDAPMSVDSGADLEHAAEDPLVAELQERGSDRARPSTESLLAGIRATSVVHGDDHSSAFVAAPSSDRGNGTVPDTRALLRDHVVPELEALGLLAQGERVDLSEASSEGGSAGPRTGRVAVSHGAVRTSDPTAVDAHTTEVHVHIDRVEVLRAAPAPAPPPQTGPASVAGPRQPSRLDHYLEHRAAGYR